LESIAVEDGAGGHPAAADGQDHKAAFTLSDQAVEFKGLTGVRVVVGGVGSVGVERSQAGGCIHRRKLSHERLELRQSGACSRLFASLCGGASQGKRDTEQQDAG
jgi:hypothetical protein